MQVILYYTLIKGRNTKSGIYRAGEALRSLGYVHISCQWLCANNKESLRTVWQRKKQSGVLEAMKRRETKKKSILNQFAIKKKRPKMSNLHNCAWQVPWGVCICCVWFSPNMVPCTMAKHVHFGLICPKNVAPATNLKPCHVRFQGGEAFP